MSPPVIVPPPPASARVRFLKAVEAKIGSPVLWAAKGPDAYDCSGLVTRCVVEAGGPDLTKLENAQGLHDHSSRELGQAPTEKPLPGDLVFYGVYERLSSTDDDLRVHIVHVAVVDEFGGVVSADGATQHITSLQMALNNPANRVRRHESFRFRKDCPVVVAHRFTLLDNLDGVSR